METRRRDGAHRLHSGRSRPFPPHMASRDPSDLPPGKADPTFAVSGVGSRPR